MKTPILDVLTQMGEDWHEQTAALVDLAVGTMLRINGTDRISITPADLSHTLELYDVKREVISTPHGPVWTIRLAAREVHDPRQLSLALETVTETVQRILSRGDE